MAADHWSIASAKAELSQVVRRAQRKPQILESRVVRCPGWLVG